MHKLPFLQHTQNKCRQKFPGEKPCIRSQTFLRNLAKAVGKKPPIERIHSVCFIRNDVKLRLVRFLAFFVGVIVVSMTS